MRCVVSCRRVGEESTWASTLYFWRLGSAGRVRRYLMLGRLRQKRRNLGKDCVTT